MIKLIKSSFYHEAETKQQLAKFILSSPVFSMGEECQKFERAFAKKQEVREAVFVGSGSAANLVLLQALLNLGVLKKGDRIGFSALTWATNIMPIIQLGLAPVPIDCEVSSLNVSPRTLEPVVKMLDGLFLTNVLGFADDIEAIKELCETNKIIFLEDNCESLGSKVNGQLLGNFGKASTFSFFVGHHMSTIEGGMICTNDSELADMLRQVRAHGWDRDLSPGRQQSLRGRYRIDPFFAKYTFYDLAYNARPTEINGLLGNIQLSYLDEIIKRRVINFQAFQRAVAVNPDLLPIEVTHMERVSNFAYPVIGRTPALFNDYRQKFEAREIEIRPIIAGDMTKQPFYQKYLPGQSECQNAEFIHSQGFYFGNNPEMTEEEIKTLVTLLKK